MAVKINQDAQKQARTLIAEGKTERESHWGSAQPDAAAENTFTEQHGWQAYADWHLAYDSAENKETKGRYKFPYGDFHKVKVHRSALIAIKQRAGSEHDRAVEAAVDELLEHFPGEDT